MLNSDCERDIQLELNRNYLKSFPARLKFCHIVSGLTHVLTTIEKAIKIIVFIFSMSKPFTVSIEFIIIPAHLLHTRFLLANNDTNHHTKLPGIMLATVSSIFNDQLEN